MKERQETETWNKVFLFLFFCLLVTTLAGCEEKNNQESHEEPKQHDVTVKPLPLSDENHTFENAYGWLSNDTILFSATKDDKQKTVLMSYRFETKEKKELYSTKETIGGVSISPGKKYILVYMSNGGSNQVGIHILTKSGHEVYSFAIPANEISFSWNPFSEDMLLIDSFNEDWSFQSYISYIGLNRMEKVDLPKPFAQWQSPHSLLYLDWNDETPQLTTPLKSFDLLTASSKSLYKESIVFKANKDVLLTINQHKKDSMAIEYTIHDWEGKTISKMKAPAIGSYSDWIIQPFDLVDKSKLLITFVPYESALMDQYKKRYQLVAFNWETGKKTVLKEKLDSAALSCSPQGNKCLYGNKLENSFEY
ncbi:hypothetical protein [Bacillus sp. 1P06AnD]|uniref:YqgU-like beta propeller domain-containing protein n=1 Tax=Bacillus sp. 1P06AnD TaxID=3132208 RepID=UPI0039A3B194